MQNKKNSRRRSLAWCLAVILAAGLLLPNETVGVLAKEDSVTTQHAEDNEASNEASDNAAEEAAGDGQETTDTEEPEENADPAENTEPVIAEQAEEDENEEAAPALLTLENGSELNLPENYAWLEELSTDELVSLDMQLLECNAYHKTEMAADHIVNVTSGNNALVINSDNYESEYSAAYNAVYAAMEARATEITEISEVSVKDTEIWKITGEVSMNGSVTVGSGGKLVILGDGTIQRNGASTMVSGGVLCLQGTVTADGGGKAQSARFISSRGAAEARGRLYLADDFKIQNFVTNDINGAGILTQYTDFYMTGGTVGSKDITFTWDDGATTVYGEATDTYLAAREAKGDYPVIRNISADKGCKSIDTAEDGVPQGGGMALENSCFVMSGGSIVGNTLWGANADAPDGIGSHGAGVDFRYCNVYITGGAISGNQSDSAYAPGKYNQYSGAIQLEAAGGNSYRCELSDVEIAYNYAQRWVGAIDIYSGNTLYLKSGAVVKYNSAGNNSGAIAVDGTGASMVMEEGSKVVHNYSGGLGGGIRCLGILTMNGGEIAYNSSASDGGGLSIQSDESRTGAAVLTGGVIKNNYTRRNGGGIGMVTGRTEEASGLTLQGTRVENNKADVNGGGIYLNAMAQSGTVNALLRSGSISGNTAKNGAGIYVSQYNVCSAELKIEGEAVEISGNTATQDGGGIYLYHDAEATGTITANISEGKISQNIAKQNGGGLYMNNGNLSISGGSFAANSAAGNGGGAYISDGVIRMFGGEAKENRAEGDGGGFYVSSSTAAAADVVIRSGTIRKNTCGGNGGGIAVVSAEGSTRDRIVIGLLETHQGLQIDENKKHTFTAFTYTDSIDSVTRQHTACPVLDENAATGNGGGIYMNSTAAELNVYCLEEKGNSASGNESGGSVMASGGTVNIGDAEHCNEDARGNVSVSSPMLVQGGKVALSGNMDNPYFAGNILVDIRQNAGTFLDNRKASDTAVDYKVHYFENFTGDGTTATGTYTAKQYDANVEIKAEGALFEHPGWRITGWKVKDSNPEKVYGIGDVIGSSADHSIWGDANTALILEAQWTRNVYTVIYEPNNGNLSVEGTMAEQKFTYGIEQALSAHGYRIAGYIFTGWNTAANGSGTGYPDQYRESKIASTAGAAVTLYAQWKKCTHDGQDGSGSLSYAADATTRTITESCSCGGHTGKVTLSGVTVYHDGKSHPAMLNYQGDQLLTGTQTITYAYKEAQNGTYGELANHETEPTSTGYYRATLTAGGVSVSVEYQIKSPAEEFQLEAGAIAGQQFAEFDAQDAVTVPQDGSFTLQYTAVRVNSEYKVAPELSFDQTLPVATTLIMQTADGEFWYYKVPDNTINALSVNAFTQMGGDGKYTYQAVTGTDTRTESYRFIVDFSRAETGYLSGARSATLTYHRDTDAKSATASVILLERDTFTAAVSTEGMTIQTPSDADGSRWKDRQLRLHLHLESLTGEKLPSDTKLTVRMGDRQSSYAMREDGEFVLPLSWNESQSLAFSMESSVKTVQGQTYTFTATVKADGQTVYTAADAIRITLPRDGDPSLKISEADAKNRIYTNKDTLKVSIAEENVDGCEIKATIQKKKDTEYSGDYLASTAVNAGENSFTLGGITNSGSYRLLITVTKDSQTLLRVPYYFIVQ